MPCCLFEDGDKSDLFADRAVEAFWHRDVQRIAVKLREGNRSHLAHPFNIRALELDNLAMDSVRTLSNVTDEEAPSC